MPTIWGWLVILLACAGALMFLVLHVHEFLAPNQPSGARVLVVEGWTSADELDQAIRTFHQGKYERVITTGGIYGQVTRLGDQSVQLQIADKIRIEVAKASVGGYQGHEPVVEPPSQ